MKIYVAIVWLVSFSVLPAQSQTSKETSSTDQPATQQAAPAGKAKMDSAKEADIRRLLDLTGVKALVAQTMDGLEKSIKPLVANSLPPGDYREKLIDLFFVKFRSKTDGQHLLDMAVPIYDKYFSHEEIRGLIQFYGTPLGQKTVSVIPQLMGELQEEGRKWGGDLGSESMQEVLAEHPDLLQALEAAEKASKHQ